MTYRTGRLGRRYARAGMMDPRGHWAREPGASAGFIPEQSPVLLGDGIVFSGSTPHCPPPGKLVGKPGNQGCIYPVGAPSQASTSSKLSRRGAPKTRLKHGMLRRKR